MYHILFFHLSAEHLGFYHIAITNNAALRIDTQISIEVSALNSFVHIPRSIIDKLNGNSRLASLSNLHLFFFSGCTILHSHQQCTRITITLQLFFVFITANLMCVKWYLIINLICTSLMIRNAEYIPVGHCRSSSKKCLQKLFAQFLIEHFLFVYLVCLFIWFLFCFMLQKSFAQFLIKRCFSCFVCVFASELQLFHIYLGY